MKNKDINFRIASVLPSQFSLTAGFVSPTGNTTASILYSASNDVSCQWNGTNSKSITIQTGSTAILDCKRINQNQKSYVNVIRTDNGNTRPLTLNWESYDKDGNPVDSIDVLQKRISLLEDEIAISQKMSVVAFMSESCPNGWYPVNNAQGRFLRGIDLSGSLTIDPDGRRQPASIQNDMIKKHTHAYKSGFHDGQSNSGTGADPNRKNYELT